LQSCCNW